MSEKMAAAKPAGTQECGNCDGRGVIYECIICGANEPRTGTCSGPHDPRSLCATLAAQPAEQASAGSGWISVADQLPPLGEEVLIFVPAAEYGKIRFDTWNEQHEDPIGMGGPTICTGEMWDEHEFEQVTHWMRPPALPPTQGE